MSETEEDRAFYAAVEAAFIERRGTPFLLSPRDFALIQQWRALGIPLEVVRRGIDEAFARREERAAVSRLEESLATIGRERPGLAAPLEAARRSLHRLERPGKTAEAAEAALA